MSHSDYKKLYEGYLDNTGYNNRNIRERYGGCGSQPTPYMMNEGYTPTPTPYLDKFGNKVPFCGTVDTVTPFTESCNNNEGIQTRTYKYKMNVGSWNRTLQMWDAEPVFLSAKETAFQGSNCIDDTTFNPGDGWKKGAIYSFGGSEPTRDNWYITYDKLFKADSNCTQLKTAPAPAPAPAPAKPAPPTTTAKPTTTTSRPNPTTAKPKSPLDSACFNSGGCDSGCCGKYKGLFGACWAFQDMCIDKSVANCGCK